LGLLTDDTPVKSVSPTNKLVDALARPLQNHVAAALNAGEMSQLPPASDPGVKSALNEHLRKILLKKGDSHFTQEVTGGRRPIEIKGFELKQGLTDQEKAGYLPVLEWFESFCSRRGLEAGSEAAEAFWQSEVVRWYRRIARGNPRTWSNGSVPLIGSSTG